MQYVLDTLIETLEQGEPAVLGAIVHSSGSAPRTSGARMLVLADGTLVGSVGGGTVEGACHAEARKLLANGDVYAEVNCDLSAADAAEEGMVCGGAVCVLLHKVLPEATQQFRKLRDCYRRGSRPMLVTRLPADDTPLQLMTLGTGADDEVPAALREQALARNKRVSFTVSHGGQEFFIEPLVKQGTVHLAGAGHVALATAHLASYVGFEVIVMDDRVEFANKKRYPQAKKVRVLDGFNACFSELGPDDYVVIVTRGHQYDRDVLAQALRTEAGYIGMIGSSSKRRATYASLLSSGFTEDDLKRVHSPIGLSIGSDTPQEIGLSIVAELVQVRAAMNR